MSDELNTTTTMVDDEMPAAPVHEGSDDVPFDTIEVSGEMDASLIAEAVETGDALPHGMYPFKLLSFEKKGKINEDGKGPDPYFAITFECTDPKYLKRKVFDNVTWVRACDLAGARAQDPEAKEKCRKRLGKMKALQAACNFKPTGSYDVINDFLVKQPELKIQVGQKERKVKDAAGKYTISTGRIDNDVIKYFPLQRTA
jgi:hypothetical protein